MRRFLSALLALVMVITMIPAFGLSDGEIPEEPIVVEEPAVMEEAEPEPETEPEPAPAPAKAEPAKEEPAKAEPAPAPAEEQPAEPVEEQPAAPAEEQPAEPAEEQPAAPAEEQPAAPAEEQPAAPAEEQPAAPAEEQPAEPTEEQPAAPAEEQPAAPAEEQPTEPAAEEPTAEPDPEEEKFSKGYALAAKDVKLYTDQYLGTLLGTLDEDTVVYATELSEDETVLAILLAVEGEAKEAWLHAEDVTPLTEEEIAAYEQEPADVEQGEVLLQNAAFTAAETAEPEAAEGEAAEEQPEEQPEAEEANAFGGYALALKDTQVYYNPYLGVVMGTLGEDTIVYVTELSEDETAVAILFAVDGAVKEGWVPVEDAAFLTEEQTEVYLQEEADLEQEGVKLHNAVFTAEEELEEKDAPSTLTDVTEAYQSAAGTVTVVLTSAALPAGGYRITDLVKTDLATGAAVGGEAATVKAKLIKVTNAGSKAKGYTSTVVIKSLGADKAHEIVITPMLKGGKAEDPNGSVVTVNVDVVAWAWKTAKPVLTVNPEQTGAKKIRLAWTGKDLNYGGESRLNWYAKTGEDWVKVPANGTDDAWTAEFDVANGDYSFAVRPEYVSTSSVKVGEAEKTLEKPFNGTASKAMKFTVDDNYEQRWYDPVEIESAMQTAAKTITIKFSAKRPADSYKVYISVDGADPRFKTTIKNSKVKVTGSSGAYTAVVSGLPEPSSNVKPYIFRIVPVKNGLTGEQNGDGQDIYHTRVLAQTFKWATLTAGTPTLKLTQTADRTVKLTVTNKAAMEGYEILAYHYDGKTPLPIADDSIIWGQDESKTTSFTLKGIDNGSQKFHVKVRKRLFWAFLDEGWTPENPDGHETWNDDGYVLAKAVSKNSKAVTLKLADFWSQKPTSVRAAQTADQGVEIRFIVKALPVPDEYIGTVGGGFIVKDVTNAKKPIEVLDEPAADLEYTQLGEAKYQVSLTLPEQKAGKHIYQIQAYNYAEDGTELKGTLVKTAGFTVQAEKNFLKNVPNVYSIEQTGVDEVTIKWEPLRTEEKVTKYLVYKFNTAKKKTVGNPVATVDESAANQQTEAGRKYYGVIIPSPAAEGPAGTKYVYVVVPQLKTKKGTRSNPVDGTITVYKPEWIPMKDTDVSIEPIGKDCTLKFTVKPAIPAAGYKAVGTNGENELEQTVPYGTDGATFTFEGLTGGEWTFTVTAINAAGEEGASYTLNSEKTKVEPPYLMEPQNLTVVSDGLGLLKAEWTAAEAFPEGIQGEYALYLDGKRITRENPEATSEEFEEVSGGAHQIRVVPVDTTNNVRGIPAESEKVWVYTSRMNAEAEKLLITPNGEATLNFTWEGQGIPASELELTAAHGETISACADVKDETTGAIIGGSITIKADGNEAGEVTISHSKGYIESEVVITLNMVDFQVSVEHGEEVFDTDDVVLILTGKESLPDGATVGYELLVNSSTAGEQEPVELDAEDADQKYEVKLPGGFCNVTVVVTLTYEDKTIQLKAILPETIKVISEEFELNGLRYQIIRDTDDKYPEYAGKLRVKGFAEGQETADAKVQPALGREVAIIGEGAFAGNTTLTSIALPNTVAIIEKQAFMNCENLKTMTTF